MCLLDSDGDGFSNGAELGDPCCEWRSGGASEPAFSGPCIADPGDAASRPKVGCRPFNATALRSHLARPGVALPDAGAARRELFAKFGATCTPGDANSAGKGAAIAGAASGLRPSTAKHDEARFWSWPDIRLPELRMPELHVYESKAAFTVANCLPVMILHRTFVD